MLCGSFKLLLCFHNSDMYMHESNTIFTHAQQLEVCTDKTEEDYSASTPALEAALSQLPHADQLHTPESTTELRYYTALRDLMESCGYDSFSWRDLYAPVRKRFQHQLSAVINLAKFREDQLQLYGELNENVSCNTNKLRIVL